MKIKPAAGIVLQNIFAIADSEYYETLDRYQATTEYFDSLGALLPRHWATQREGFWLHAHNEVDAHSTPTQGFKIHVSIAPQYAQQVLNFVVPVCVESNTLFKLAADPTLLHILNSKGQERGHAGKFITIYPGTELVFVELLEKLYQVTRRKPFYGPYILSDRRYKDSHILYYRYGGFFPPYRLNSDGTRSSFLVTPNGDYVADERLPYFQLPPWVEDPFGGSKSLASNDELLLDDKYLIQGVVGFTNAGGVYYGVERETERPLIIKEARPWTNCWTVHGRFWDATHLLRREFAMLQRVQNLDCVPTPIDLVRYGEHTYLVEEKVPGIPLGTYWAQEGTILAPYIRWPGRIERFTALFKKIALELIERVLEVHDCGVLIGDLSPNNILIDTDSLKLSLIDFESATVSEDNEEELAYATHWGTAGYTNPSRNHHTRPKIEDDYYSIGMVLFNSVIPANLFLTLNPDAHICLLDKFVQLGLPIEIKLIILKLLAGSVDEAIKELKSSGF